MGTFRWGVIGAGIIADKVMNEIVSYERHELCGAYSRSYTSAQKLTDKYGGIAFESVDELLQSQYIDAVYIATPHSSHYEYMLKCIDNNKPCLCEKSFTVNATQAQHVVDYARAKKVYCCEAMWTRFNPVVKQIKDIISGGDLGKIRQIDADFSIPMMLSPHSDRVYSPNFAGGSLLDVGVYPISYAQMLLGDPRQIESITKIAKSGVDKSNKIFLTMDNGAVCNLSCSHGRLGSITAKIICDNGTVVSPLFYRPRKAHINGTSGCWSVFGCNGYTSQFNKVADDILLGKLESEEMPHKDTVAVMKIMDKVREAARLIYPREIEKLNDDPRYKAD